MATKKKATAKVTEEVTEKVEEVQTAGFNLEDGVEVPQRTRLGRWDFLKTMAVGQSFLIANSEYQNPQIEARKAYQAGLKTHGISLVTRKVENGIRIWRTA